MRNVAARSALAGCLLSLALPSRASYQVGQVDLADLTGPCFVNAKPCGSVKTGFVMQVFAGEDLHAYRKDAAYQADSYRAGESFRPEALLGSRPFATLEELNRHLESRGFKKLSEAELTGENPADRKRKGVVVSRLDGVDMLLRREGSVFTAVHYEFTRIFVTDAKRGSFEFKTLDELNDHLVKTARRLRGGVSL
ncbi:MAG: hypothetical protein WC943_11165 [Elusimicrobiota bacterium]|jgi:hypothetical protein